MKKFVRTKPKQRPKPWIFQTSTNPLKTKGFCHNPFLTTLPHHR
ncbi:MAG: hypothetical protein OXM55_07520 [Bdellovibrionales bacterium]|nr:hypothetical protein [Bdellovibrionales bacterium]